MRSSSAAEPAAKYTTLEEAARLGQRASAGVRVQSDEVHQRTHTGALREPTAPLGTYMRRLRYIGVSSMGMLIQPRSAARTYEYTFSMIHGEGGEGIHGMETLLSREGRS